MAFYSDNRFDSRHTATYHYSAPIGPRGRTVNFHVKTKALLGYPGWHLIRMHGDYTYSVECSSREICGAIGELQSEWVASVCARYGTSLP